MLIGSDGVCLVPWEVIQPPHFTVGAFCGSRVTSNRAQIFVQESVSLDTTATAAPTPSVYEQILTLLENSGIGAGGIAVEKDPTVPACVKGITEADIRKWHAALAAESDPTVPDCVKSITPEQIAQWNTPAAFSGLSDAEKEALTHAVAEGLLYTEEEWTFTLDSGEIVTKKVVLGT